MFDPRELFSVKDLVVVITGGGSGIGLMVARALDANGAKAVYIVGRREDSLKKAAAQCPNGTVTPIVGDVTSKDSLASIADRVRQDHGYIDVLFANSGISGPHMEFPKDRKLTLKEWRNALWDVPMEDFTKALHVNCTGVLYSALAFLELLDEGNKRNQRPQKSQVIVTASIASFNRTIAHNPAYPASKAAVMNLVKTLATYLAPFHLRVNALAPGLYPSEMTAGHSAVREGKHPSEEGALPSEAVPLERMGSEEDMAATALFMMGSGGAYLCGSVLVTDGGRLSQIPATY